MSLVTRGLGPGGLLTTGGLGITDYYGVRIIECIDRLRDEHRKITSSQLCSFLIYYFTCEVVAKLIIVRSNPQKDAKKILRAAPNLASLRSALKKCAIKQNENDLNLVFSSAKVSAQKMSARMLRNHIVHEMSASYINAMNSRFSILVDVMDRFLQDSENAFSHK